MRTCLAALSMLTASCSAFSGVPVKEGCQVIDTAHKACVLLMVIDPATGQATDLHLSPEDVEEIRRQALARHKAKQAP